MTNNSNLVSLDRIRNANTNIKGVVKTTPLQFVQSLSELHDANVFLKREDLQVVRSYKLRGAYNKISSLSKEALKKGIVCASAGNHAQGVAFACKELEVHGVIFMPVTTPMQKIQQVRMFGGDFVRIELIGDTFDESFHASKKYCNSQNTSFVHPFDDIDVIAGQGTVGLEILQNSEAEIDYLILPVGGGGLASGVGSVFKQLSPDTKIIGVEPTGAPSLKVSLENGKNTELEHIEKFVDGAAVKKLGDQNFEYCKEVLEDVLTIDEGLICATILKVYNENALVVEPAGALSIAALHLLQDKIKGKNVVCVVSGGNNDITRMEEMKERALLYQGLKHYFLVKFPQRPGALKEFVVDVLGANDDIVHFEYTKKNQRSTSTALVGIELKNKLDFDPLLSRMETLGFLGKYLNDDERLFEFIT
ncbi:MAG: threonine dehydratase [Bacteroidetes bacterium MedPE-SWsnd-G1]|nr:MAG: threonine dehydratase [Bacteroidetes bacterium MedPE-SWsnd-G1]